MKRPPIHPYAREARLRERLWKLYGALDPRDRRAEDVHHRIWLGTRRVADSYRHAQNWSAFNPPLDADWVREFYADAEPPQ